jgi:hypothetical protein
LAKCWLLHTTLSKIAVECGRASRDISMPIAEARLWEMTAMRGNYEVRGLTPTCFKIKAVIAMARYVAMAVDSAGLLPQAEEALAQVEE